MTDLDDATTPGTPNAWPANAGEFAARWNSAGPLERDQIVRNIVDNAERAQRCTIEAHHDHIRQLQLALNTVNQNLANDGARRDAVDVVAPTTVARDPDCVAGKHELCNGQGWDTVAEEPAPCPCPCGHPGKGVDNA